MGGCSKTFTMKLQRSPGSYTSPNGGVQVFPLSWKVLEYTPFPFVSLHLFIYWSQADGNYWFLPCPVAANHPHDVGQDQHSTYTTKKTTPRSF